MSASAARQIGVGGADSRRQWANRRGQMGRKPAEAHTPRPLPRSTRICADHP